MMEKKEKKENNDGATPMFYFDKDKFKAFIRRDFFYILLLLFALFACIYTWYSVDDIVYETNQHWIEQFDRCGCLCLGEWETAEQFEGDPHWDGVGIYQQPKNYTLEDIQNAIRETNTK